MTTPEPTITRCYRYSLAPSQVQREAILQTARTARRFWNALVACERYAEREIRHGRQGWITSALTQFLLAKKLTGNATFQGSRSR